MKFEIHWPEEIKHLIMLTIGWLMFSLLVGLYRIFKILESMDDNQTSAIVAGLKFSGITFFGGAILIGSALAVLSSIKKGAFKLPF